MMMMMMIRLSAYVHVPVAGRPPLMVLAHSIGCYMMVNAIDQLTAANTSANPHADARLPHVAVDVHAYASSSSAEAAGTDEAAGVGRWLAQHRAPSPPPPLPSPPSPLPSQLAAPAAAADMNATTWTRGVGDGRDGLKGAASVFKGGDGWLTRGPAVQPSWPASARVPPIVKVVALMPFFQGDFDNQPEQRMLRTLAARYRLVSMAVRLLAALPLVVRMALVHWWTGDALRVCMID
jgi:hypothetical protein